MVSAPEVSAYMFPSSNYIDQHKYDSHAREYLWVKYFLDMLFKYFPDNKNFIYNCLIYTCHNINGGLAKLPLNLRRGWDIAPPPGFMLMQLLIEIDSSFFSLC